MTSIIEDSALANLPGEEWEQAGLAVLAPVLAQLPEKRLRDGGVLAVQGLLAAQSPIITQMARGGKEREEETTWPVARRLYRFVWNPRFTHCPLLKGLYAIAPKTVAQSPRPYLSVALDPVNGEKPYTRELGGVCTAMKSTPPGPAGHHLCPLVLLPDGGLWWPSAPSPSLLAIFFPDQQTLMDNHQREYIDMPGLLCYHLPQ